MAGRSVTDGSLEGERGQVVAFVDHDQPVATEECVEVIDCFEALDHCEVDDSGELAPAAAFLADLLRGESEQCRELSAPLFEQWLAVCEDERRELPLRDQRARDDGLAGSGWRDENAVIVREHCENCGRLERGQLPAKLERQRHVGWPAVIGDEPATRARDRIFDLAKQATRDAEVGQVLFVAADQPGVTPNTSLPASISPGHPMVSGTPGPSWLSRRARAPFR